MSKYLEDLRIDYFGKELDEKRVPENPLDLFSEWFCECLDGGIELANAMTLSTADSENKVSSRVVLMKEFDEKGILFFSDYNSRKSIELNNNPSASLLFFWEKFYRQVRIEGEIKKASVEESDKYFSTRPRESQIAAWVSEQSCEIKNRDYLLRREKEFIKQFENNEVPRPKNWGGLKLVPDYFEFWQGRQSRLHDRITYSFENQKWKIKRLAP